MFQLHGVGYHSSVYAYVFQLFSSRQVWRSNWWYFALLPQSTWLFRSLICLDFSPPVILLKTAHHEVNYTVSSGLSLLPAFDVQIVSAPAEYLRRGRMMRLPQVSRVQGVAK